MNQEQNHNDNAPVRYTGGGASPIGQRDIGATGTNGVRGGKTEAAWKEIEKHLTIHKDARVMVLSPGGITQIIE
jgi:hypothetical protein